MATPGSVHHETTSSRTLSELLQRLLLPLTQLPPAGCAHISKPAASLLRLLQPGITNARCPRWPDRDRVGFPSRQCLLPILPLVGCSLGWRGQSQVGKQDERPRRHPEKRWQLAPCVARGHHHPLAPGLHPIILSVGPSSPSSPEALVQLGCLAPGAFLACPASCPRQRPSPWLLERVRRHRQAASSNPRRHQRVASRARGRLRIRSPSRPQVLLSAEPGLARQIAPRVGATSGAKKGGAPPLRFGKPAGGRKKN